MLAFVCLQIHYFAILNILVLFLAMGVGADDLFVIVDAWKQTNYEVLHAQKVNFKPY